MSRGLVLALVMGAAIGCVATQGEPRLVTPESLASEHVPARVVAALNDGREVQLDAPEVKNGWLIGRVHDCGKEQQSPGSPAPPRRGDGSPRARFGAPADPLDVECMPLDSVASVSLADVASLRLRSESRGDPFTASRGSTDDTAVAVGVVLTVAVAVAAGIGIAAAVERTNDLAKLRDSFSGR
jgi:plasmid stability protein